MIEARNGEVVNIGDVVELNGLGPRYKEVTVIGLGDHDIAFTNDRIEKNCRLGEYSNKREEYSIPDKYDDDTYFFTVGSSCIVRVVKKNPTRRGWSRKTTGNQIRDAAWGEEVHIPPPGAPFQFL